LFGAKFQQQSITLIHSNLNLFHMCQDVVRRFSFSLPVLPRRYWSTEDLRSQTLHQSRDVIVMRTNTASIRTSILEQHTYISSSRISDDYSVHTCRGDKSSKDVLSDSHRPTVALVGYWFHCYIFCWVLQTLDVGCDTRVWG
jgi:hypothetical protein